MKEQQIGLIAASTYSQVFNSTLRSIYRTYSDFGIKMMPEVIRANNFPFTFRVHNSVHWCNILIRSLEVYESLSGIEICFAWIDEVFLAKKEAIDVVAARLRDASGFPCQLLLTSTKDEIGSSLYKFVVENYHADLMDVFEADSYANHKHLPSGYIEGLKSLYSENLYKRMVLNQWVHLSGTHIYYNFNRALHVSDEIEFDEHLDILWTHDFNIGMDKPMSSCLCHIKKGMFHGKYRPELHVFDEIIMNTADTYDIFQEFVTRNYHQGKPHRVVIYGDASGRARDTRSKTTDYAILRNAGFVNQKIPSANPPIRERHNALNSLLRNTDGDIRIKIHSRCVQLAKGLESVRLKQGSQYVEEETYTQHVTTAIGYLVCREFPLRTVSTKSQEI